MAQYRAMVGIDYPPNKRVEAGDVVSDLPGDSITWLLDQGLIETLDKKSTPKVEIKEEPKIEEPVVEEPAVETPAETPVSEESEAE